MKFIKYIFIFAIFIMFSPKVYADGITVTAKANNTVVEAGSEVVINVNLKSDELIAECLFDFESNNNIQYISMKAMNQWTLLEGTKGTSLSNGNISTNTLSAGLNILELKYKVNKSGRVKTLECVSINENEYSHQDVIIDFSIKQENIPSNEDEHSGNVENNNDVKSPLVGIVLSEGDIDFVPNVYEYNVTVTNFDDLEVTLNLNESNISYSIVKDEFEKKVNITLVDNEGNTTNYVINVTEIEEPKEEPQEKEKFNFIPIFIGIICLLVLVNIFRRGKSNPNEFQ